MKRVGASGSGAFLFIWDLLTAVLQDELEKVHNLAARLVTESGSMTAILDQLKHESSTVYCSTRV